MRVLSGMQPSGNPHIGNYLGAMRQHVEMQQKAECFYFLANYHALTTMRDGPLLREKTNELAIDFLALGLDPKRTALFRQSDIPEVTELTWIFNTLTPVSLLERAHAWKDSIQKGRKGETVGLFDYPVLMAADILIYQSERVPVGQDQKQHVEMSRDIAAFFNKTYGETFTVPEADITKEVAVVPGTDGQKMSKSYGNVIEIFAPADTLKRQVFSIKTDSKGMAEAKDPKACLPFLLLQFFLSEKDAEELAVRLSEGGIGYAELKTRLFETLLEYFSEARAKHLELHKKPDYVEDVLVDGARRARKIAQKTMEEVRKKTGLARAG